MKYRIYLDDEMISSTNWLPVAQAAWDRAARDRDAATHDGCAALQVDGRVVAAVRPRTLEGHAWPLAEDHITDLRDAAKALLMLMRTAGVSAQDLATAMTANGLPTTAARLKSISTTEQGRRSSTSPAELVAMCYAAASRMREANASRP